MGKKLKVESAKFHFLSACRELSSNLPHAEKIEWNKCIDNFRFEPTGTKLEVFSELSDTAYIDIDLTKVRFYLRGDSENMIRQQGEALLMFAEDHVRDTNYEVFIKAAQQMLKHHQATHITKPPSTHDSEMERYEKEEQFHDDWADSVDISQIDVMRANEVCTAPEMRYIYQELGDLTGKRVLDVGCGLGEVSVYLALKGAKVTSVDISSGMLRVTSALAERYKVSVDVHLATAEGLGLPEGELFDIIYAGNLLHHVDIESALHQFHKHLKQGGLLVTWDPIAYNPAINIYRERAMDVRTEDEHPLRWKDLRLYNEMFSKVNRRYFWLTTLIIFVIMALVQKREPNKERYWKIVIDEAEKWKKIYRPLEFLDRILLAIFPPLRLWCWNVVIIARK
ncbi:MAG: class I SAM-dependent methyltransferase [Gammaproteobacteria bacterium]|nr:class I SAM-dependent methyltransferase [Gammaproteobacteria bacterium]